MFYALYNFIMELLPYFAAASLSITHILRKRGLTVRHFILEMQLKFNRVSIISVMLKWGSDILLQLHQNTLLHAWRMSIKYYNGITVIKLWADAWTHLQVTI